LNPDFLIVGGGVIGLSTALELARDGAKVHIVERGLVGHESSWAGGGILSPLLPWDYTEQVTRLTRWGSDLYPGWIDLLAASGIDPEYRRSGMLVLPEFDEAAALDWCRGHQTEAELVTPSSLVPDIGVDGRALWLPEVAQVRNPRLLKAARRSAEALGVGITENAEVTGLKVTGDRLEGVETTKGMLAGGACIITGGAWSKQILGEYALKLDIRPVRGQMLLFRTPPGMLRPILLQDGIYLIPRDDGLILVGSTMEEAGFDKTVTRETRVSLRDRAVAILPAMARAEFVHHWAGLRPGSPENIPTIARHPRIENLYVNSGHFRYGVTMAPASAHLLVNLIFGRPQPFDVSPYSWPVA
jgi:glycine oxidase